MIEFFNPGQLSLLKSVAEECERGDANGAEMAVWEMLGWTRGWEPEQLAVIEYICRECERQQSGAFSVYLMCWTWEFATVSRSQGVVLDEELLGELAIMLEPVKNAQGYRRHVVTARGGTVIGSNPEHIPGDMAEFGAMLEAFQRQGLREHWGRPVTPQSLYERFERIHPRPDGNGRLGKIIFNWTNNTLTAPVLPELPEGFVQV